MAGGCRKYISTKELCAPLCPSKFSLSETISKSHHQFAMELTNFFLLLAALTPLAVADNGLLYGRAAKSALLARDDVPLKAMVMVKRSNVEMVYARIQRDIFYGGFEDSLNKRQLCGSGETCSAACASCGSGFKWCGTETGGSCDCSDENGSCTGGGSGGSGGGGGESTLWA